jgi:hypothetical protein
MLSGIGRVQLAATQVALARLRGDSMAGLEALEMPALRGAARQQLRLAMREDPANPLPVLRLGQLLASQGDVVAIRELIPPLEVTFRQRPYSSDLAALLVRLHVLTGDKEAQFKYALIEQRMAATEAARLTAARRVERLRTLVKTTPKDVEESLALSVPAEGVTPSEIPASPAAAATPGSAE